MKITANIFNLILPRRGSGKATIPLAALLLLSLAGTAQAQGTAFTYQGRLNDGGGPATGIYDLRFTIYDAVTNGNPIAGPLTNSATGVTNGLFTVALDFGPGVFTGPALWLQLDVQTNGGAGFIPLLPRQQILPTPYAIMANSASNLLGALPAAQLSVGTANISISGNAATATTANSANSVSATNITGTLSDAQLSANVALLNASQTFTGTNSFSNASNSFTGSFAGNGAGLTNLSVPAASLTGVIAPAQLPGQVLWNNEVGVTLNGTFSGVFSGDGSGLTNLNAWLLTGNAGTICGPNFLGTTDNQPLELAVNSLPVLWLGPSPTPVGNGGNTIFRQDNGNTILPLPPTTTSAYCIISGGQNNTVGNSVQWGTISGGGGNSLLDNASASTIGGGYGNNITGGANDATISGGFQNFNSGNYATVGGGSQNANNGAYATLGGGQWNNIWPNAQWATIGGGEWNTIQGSSQAGTIAGGYDNFIPAGGTYATIGGGCSNIASGAGSFVGGGGSIGAWIAGNTASGLAATIGGGLSNSASGAGSFVGGGGYDGTTIIGNAAVSPAATIGGGRGNVIQILSSYSFIGGGDTNTIQSYSPCSVIGGGHNNIIWTNSPASTIGGGSNNTVQANSSRSFIGGGCNNTLQTNTFVSTIGGGSNNTIQANSFLSFIGGGSQNTLQPFATNSTIGGGYQNTIQTSNIYSIIAGGEGNIIQAGLQHATIGGGEDNIVTTNFGTIPGGHHTLSANYAQLAYAGGLFQNPGDSQYSLYVLRNTCNNSVTNAGILYLDGGAINGTSEIVLPGNRSCSFEARIVGRDASGNTCAFNLRGGAYKASSGLVTVQVPWNEKLMDTFTGSPCSATLTSTGLGDGKLRVQVTGTSSNDSVRWTATVETAEVANP